ncbi:MAG: hypothetical protein AB7E36_03630 [Salinivirgaceae bacterium]
MTTLRITVDNKKNAKLLTKMLSKMNFVKKVEEEKPSIKYQYASLKKIFSEIKPDALFQKVQEPLSWQKEIRDEWETC